MARIAGVEVPNNKRVEIGLTYIYGIGRTTSNQILAKTGINPDTRCKDLTEDDVSKLRDEIENFHKENPDFLVAKSLYLDGAVRPGSDVVELSKIPDRQGMLAQLVAIILGPGSTIAGQLKSLTEKLEKEQAGASA